MYKVFFNNRIIFFADKLTEEKSFFKKIVFSEENKIPKSLILEFEKDPSTENMIIIGSDLEKLFENFISHFLFMEAAGGLVINNKKQFLSIFRLKKWDLPKGKKEFNETIKETALREVREECGISNIEIKEELTPSFHTYRLYGHLVLKKTHWFKMFFNGDESLKPQREEYITEAIWINIKDKEKVMRKTYDSIIEVLKHL